MSMGPWQSGQTPTSSLKTRASSLAQGVRDGSVGSALCHKHSCAPCSSEGLGTDVGAQLGVTS